VLQCQITVTKLVKVQFLVLPNHFSAVQTVLLCDVIFFLGLQINRS